MVTERATAGPAMVHACGGVPLLALLLLAVASAFVRPPPFARIRIPIAPAPIDASARLALIPLRASKLADASIGAGATGILILIANRLFNMDAVTDVQSRADILSMIACSGLLLNAFSEQEIKARDRDPVALMGFSLREPLVSEEVGGRARAAFAWLSGSVIRSTPATSVHVFDGDRLLSQAGVVSADPSKGPVSLRPVRPILAGALADREEVYLPDLQILPGKIEFSYLPLNCQSLLIMPLSSSLAVVVGTNRAKALKSDDLSRIRALVGLTNGLLLS